jgi:uncharacterized SAM-binding protein YcdF (DUF218 family)
VIGRGRDHEPMLALWLAPVFVLMVLMQDAANVLGAQPAGPEWRGRHCPVDALVVMGAAQYDGRPSPAFERRLLGALELFRDGCADIVVVSGGRRRGDRFSEGEAGVAYLRARGVPSAALRDESQARTSVENLRNVSAMLGAVRIAIVTDDLHAHRTAVAARRLGIDAVLAPVAVPHGRLPYAAREVGALFGYRLGVFR